MMASTNSTGTAGVTGYGVSMRVLFFSLAIGVVTSVGAASADIVRLNDGGAVRGTIVSRPNGDGITVESLTGVTITVSRDDVAALNRRPIEAELYVDKAAAVADTVAAHRELAEWARSEGLRSAYREQLQEVIRLEPDDESARKSLGYVVHEGRWMTRDEIKMAEGFIQVGRKWVTPAEAALMTEIDETSERAKAWYPKAIDMRRRLKTAFGQERKHLLDEIAFNDDRDALAAWRKIFASHPDVAIRTAYIVALSKWGHPQVVKPLAAMAVEDISDDVRQTAIDAVPRKHSTFAAQALVRWLNDDDNIIIRRAAYAIGEIGDPAVTGRLVRSLQTGHWKTVQYIDNTPAFGRSGNNIGYTGSPLLPPEVEAGLRTGQYPYGVNVTPPANRVRTKRVRILVRNEEVLKALIKTTGQNFGYNELAWTSWWRRTRG